MPAKLSNEIEWLLATELSCGESIGGDVASLLSAFMELNLAKLPHWPAGQWIDDSLPTRVEGQGDDLKMWGVSVYVSGDRSEQMTAPFYFEVKLAGSRPVFLRFRLLFAEEGTDDMSYTTYRRQSGCFDAHYYQSDDWNPRERRWRYGVKG